MCGRTLIGCVMIFSAQPRGDCFLPLNPCAHWAAISSVIPNNFKLTAGAAAPLSDFKASRKIVLKRRMASLDSVQQRGGAARSAGIYPADYFHMRSRR